MTEYQKESFMDWKQKLQECLNRCEEALDDPDGLNEEIIQLEYAWRRITDVLCNIANEI